MTCAHCGTVGVADARWCPQCYLPYAPLTSHGVQNRGTLPWQAPTPPPAPPVFAAPAPPQPRFGPPPAYGPPVLAPPVFVTAANPFPQPPSPGGPPPGGWPAKLGLVVPQHAVEIGDLPHMCVVSGEPTDNFVKLRWAWAPGWTYVLGLLIRLLISDKVSGYLPVAPKIRRRMVLAPWWLLAGTIVGLFVAIVGFASPMPLLGVLGFGVFIAVVVRTARVSSVLPVKRAAPGFLALPKASPEFVEAFKAGRPADQRPFATEPARYSTRASKIAVGVLVAFLVLGSVVSAVSRNSCSSRHLHPELSAMNAAFATARAQVDAVNASAQNRDFTIVDARAIQAAHQQRLQVLRGLDLSSGDRESVESEANAAASYDVALIAYVQDGSDVSRQVMDSAEATMDRQMQALNDELSSKPADCT